MSYDIFMSTLNEVFMKVEGKSTVEQGKFICIIHIKSIFQMTVCQFSIYNVLHVIRTKECNAEFDSAFWERLSLFPNVINRTTHRSLLGMY